MNRRRAPWFLATALAVALGVAAAADELVTRDGQVVRTQGPWEVRGKLVVFELADGTLASMRLSEVDLEASEERARQAELRAQRAREAARRPEPEPEPRQAVMVLTDRDVRHAPDLGEVPETEGGPEDEVTGAAEISPAAPADAVADRQGDAEGEEGEAVGGAVDSSGQGVQVVQWSQESAGEDGVEVRGVIQNLGASFATSLAVNALFYDETGSLVAAREVQFEEGPLGPGARRDFSVSLPHSLIYDEIRFQVVGRGFRSVGQSVFTEPRQPELEAPIEPPQ